MVIVILGATDSPPTRAIPLKVAVPQVASASVPAPTPLPPLTPSADNALELFEAPHKSSTKTSATPKAPGPAPKPVTPEKKLSTQEVRAVLLSDEAKERYKACAKSGEGIVRVKLTIEASGKVSVVTTEGDGALDKCIAKVVRGLQFPSFSGGSQGVSIPITVKAE
jgi:outer membrane biosynthesis protein TonB